MTGTTKSSVLTHPTSWLPDRDMSWYGTLGVLAACLVVMATLVLTI
jgi:hypothetical protein